MVAKKFDLMFGGKVVENPFAFICFHCTRTPLQFLVTPRFLLQGEYLHLKISTNPTDPWRDLISKVKNKK